MSTANFPSFTFRDGARRSARPWQELIVDNFAGGGGASLGIEAGACRAVDISINHDPDAVAMHAANHPASRHLLENVWQVNPRFVSHGRPVGLAWFSPDCRHFSRAKGGKPVEKRIRGLAWIVCRWAGLVRPRVIILENVREFRTWGPLNRNHRPIKAKVGQTFRRWVAQLQAAGYVVEWRELDAADFGAPTHRKRLFVVARCDGRAIAWPEKTHGRAGEVNDVFSVGRGQSGRGCPSQSRRRLSGAQASSICGGVGAAADGLGSGRAETIGPGPRRLKPFRTAAECIDWSIPCHSIFDRKRPLAEKTMRRIAMGLKRYVLDNPRPFIVRCAHGEGSWGHAPRDIDLPLPTMTASKDFAVVTPYLVPRNGERDGQEPRAVQIDRPINTITADANCAMLVSPLLVGAGGPGYAAKPCPTDAPLNVVQTENHTALVSAWLVKHFGGVVGHEIDKPAGTVTSVDHHALACAYLARFNHGEKQWNGVDEPLGTVTSQGNKFGLVYAFLAKYYATAIGQPVDEPLHTATAKARFGVVTVTIAGQTYAIADVGMRMLSPRELARAQGFPDTYILTGTKTSQVAKIGNSVCPVMAEVLVRANYADPEAEVAA